MQQAKYYTKKEKDVVQCHLCPTACVLAEGEVGDCRVRVNHDGELYTKAYGNPVAAHVDPIEKKPLFHFYPGTRAFSIGTAGCNLHCLNCQNAEISQCSPDDIRNVSLSPQEVVDNTLAYNGHIIAYTYTEPTVFYEYMYVTAVLAHQKGLKNVMITAGYINPKPLKDLIPYLDAANIDLKSFDEETYRKINKVRLKPVLKAMQMMKEAGVWLEITNLVIPGWTDNMETIQNMCEWLVANGFDDAPLHFSRFHPTYRLLDAPPTPFKTLKQAKQIALDAGIQHVFIGNVPGTEDEHTFCPQCGKRLINRHGFGTSAIKITNGNCDYCGAEIPGVWGD